MLLDLANEILFVNAELLFWLERLFVTVSKINWHKEAEYGDFRLLLKRLTFFLFFFSIHLFLFCLFFFIQNDINSVSNQVARSVKCSKIHMYCKYPPLTFHFDLFRWNSLETSSLLLKCIVLSKNPNGMKLNSSKLNWIWSTFNWNRTKIPLCSTKLI